MNSLRLHTLVLSTSALFMLGMVQPDHGVSRPSTDDAKPAKAENPEARGRLGLELQLDPDALRIRLVRMIERGEEMAVRGQAALEKLDSGAPATEVLEELRGNDEPSRARGDARRDTPTQRNPNERRSRPGGDEERQAIQQFLQKEFPELWAKFEPFLRQDPRDADRLLGRMAPQIREILALKQSHPELAKIKTAQMRTGLDFGEAARLYRLVLSNPDSTQSDREEALNEIRSHAEARFDAELEAKQLEIDRLEARLNQLRDSVSELEQRREQEVDKMVDLAHRNAERLARQQAQKQRSGAGASGSGDD